MSSWRIRKDAEWWAKTGVAVQLIILVRTTAEFYRLRYEYGQATALARFEPYVGGLLIDSVLCLVSLLLLFWRKPVASAITSAITVLALVAYKIVAIG